MSDGSDSEIEEDNDNLIPIKTVLIGESNVGKTSIISSFSRGVFNEHEKVTTGATFSTKKVFYEKYEKCVKFEIWDTCGQEKYRSLTHLFYKDAIVAILVYDITSRKSYDEVTNFWYYEIKEKGAKNVIIVLCGNKSDLFEQETVTGEEARKWALVRQIPFFETSAKNSTGIGEMYFEIGKQYLNTIYDFSEINKNDDEKVHEDIVNGYSESENSKKADNKKKEKSKKEEKAKEKRKDTEKKKDKKIKGTEGRLRTDSIKLKKEADIDKDETNASSNCC